MKKRSIKKASGKCQRTSILVENHKILYGLLTFEGSNKTYIKKIEEVKVQGNLKVLKQNGASYQVQILAVHTNKELLENLASNLNFGWPKVSLQRIGNEFDHIELVQNVKVITKEKKSQSIETREITLPLHKLENYQPLAQLEYRQPVAHLENLQPENLHPVAQLENLQPENIHPVAQLENLQPDAQLENLQPVAQLEYLQPVAQLENLQPDAQLENLQPVAQLENLQPVAQLENLQPVAQLEYLQPVAQLENLQPFAPNTELAEIPATSDLGMLSTSQGLIFDVSNSITTVDASTSNNCNIFDKPCMSLGNEGATVIERETNFQEHTDLQAMIEGDYLILDISDFIPSTSNDSQNVDESCKAVGNEGATSSGNNCSDNFYFNDFLVESDVDPNDQIGESNIDSNDQLDENIVPMEEFETGPNTVMKKGKSKKKHKQHYCKYCGILTVSLPRHLTRIHKREEDVKKAVSYAKNTAGRRRCFDEMRKEGDFLYNKGSGGEEIVVRISNKPAETTYLPCSYCSGYYSAKNLRHHVRERCLYNSDSKRNLHGRSIVKGSFVHELACDNLKNHVFTTMRPGPTFNLVTTDLTAVLFGNKLAEYITLSKHHIKMVSSKLRLLATIFFEMKRRNPLINEIKDIFCPKQYSTLVAAVKVIGGYDGEQYKAPTVVHSSCNLIKKVAHVLKCSKIQSDDKEGYKNVDNFLYLLTQSQNSDMTKLATETRTRQQRIKREVLPTTAEINNLMSTLEKNIDDLYNLLQNAFDQEIWEQLSQLTMLYILIFNRKRPGDIQRTEVVEYATIVSITDENCARLSESEKMHANNFVRYVSRGKLNRSASILLSKKVRAAIDLLISYRERAGVKKDCKYLFVNPATNHYYDAHKTLQKYCINRGFPTGKFTATALRKHLATTTATLPKQTQTVITDFMGHSAEIHNNIYVQRDALIDITVMGGVLTDASGINETISSSTSSCQPTTNLVQPQWLDNNDSSSASDAECPSFSTKSIEKRRKNLRAGKNLSIIMEEKSNDQSFNTILSSQTPAPLNGDSPIPQNGDSPITQNKDSLTQSFSSTSSYHPDDETSDSSRETHTPLPFLRKKNTTWSSPERAKTREVFADYFKAGNVPSLTVIQNRKSSFKTFSRSSLQIQGWIRADIQRTKRGKVGWTTPQKMKCRTYFSEYYNKTASSVYPSLQAMQRAIETVEEFKEKTIPNLRSHLQHDFAYVKRQRNSI